MQRPDSGSLRGTSPPLEAALGEPRGSDGALGPILPVVVRGETLARARRGSGLLPGRPRCQEA